jgi:hypothetical protein
MAQYGHGLVFVDEAGMDDRWAPLGQVCVRRTSFLRGQKYSIIPALSFDRILVLDIFEGVYKFGTVGALSAFFVVILYVCFSYCNLFSSSTGPQQAPHLNLFPMEQSVVVMDNSSIHYEEDIRQRSEVEHYNFINIYTTNPNFRRQTYLFPAIFT